MLDEGFGHGFKIISWSVSNLSPTYIKAAGSCLTAASAILRQMLQMQDLGWQEATIQGSRTTPIMNHESNCDPPLWAFAGELL